MSFTSQRRDLALVIAARAISLLGDEAAAVALLLRLQSQGAGAWAVAGLLTAALAPIVVLAPVVGRLVDRWDNRALLVGSSAVQALLCTALAFAGGTVPVLALVALLGAGQAVNGTCWQALLPSIVGPERLPRALGLSQATTTAAAIAALALGGLLTGWYGARVPLLVDAGTFLAVTVAALLVRTRRALAADAGEAHERGGFAIVAADPLLSSTLILLGVFITLGAAVNVVDVFLVRETLHATAAWYGLVGAAWGVGLALGALGAGRWHGSGALARGLVGSCATLSLCIAAYGLAPSVSWLLPVAVLGGVANGALNVTSGALLMQRIAEEERGRLAAVIGAVASGSQIGAFVLAGMLASTFTPRQVFLSAGLFGLLGPVAFGRRVLQTAGGMTSEERGHGSGRVRTPDPVGHSRDGVDSARVLP